MFNLILFGPPGSGKGTQSSNIIEKYKVSHIATGDLLRDEVKRSTPLGMEAKRYMDNGSLVPDEVVIGMIGSKLEANPDAKGFIFDGFPRTTAQAEALDKLLEKHNTTIHLMLALEVPEEELKTRLLSRGATSGRSDDNEEIIAKRIIEYKEKTAPVADYYKQQNKFSSIEGVGSIDEIFARIQDKINALV